MALSVHLYIGHLFRRNLHAFVLSRNIHITQAKQLYTPTALGIDNYLQSRKYVNERLANYSEKFRAKMISFIADDKNMIFTEDLKNMVHLAEPADLDVILKMIKKFNSNTEIRFGSYIFGPVVMRMFHFLDAPKEALECFYEPVNKNFFDQQMSFQILLDLLYNNEMYEEMFKVFERIQEKQLNMTKFPKYSVILILAACYKQNTPESFEYASNLWTDMTRVGTMPLRRASTLFAGLALKQGAPEIALEAISSQKQHYVTIRNIKALGLAEIGRLDDALQVLRFVLDHDQPHSKFTHTFFEETISKVKAAVEKSKKDDLIKEFIHIEKALKDRGLVDKQNLDTHLCADINVIDKPRDTQQQHGDRRMPFNHRKRNVY